MTSVRFRKEGVRFQTRTVFYTYSTEIFPLTAVLLPHIGRQEQGVKDSNQTIHMRLICFDLAKVVCTLRAGSTADKVAYVSKFAAQLTGAFNTILS